jgi:hypothetical protein
MEEIENNNLKIKGRIYGSAPVQAEGTIHGFEFYFRADMMGGHLQFLKTQTYHQ